MQAHIFTAIKVSWCLGGCEASGSSATHTPFILSLHPWAFQQLNKAWILTHHQKNIYLYILLMTENYIKSLKVDEHAWQTITSEAPQAESQGIWLQSGTHLGMKSLWDTKWIFKAETLMKLYSLVLNHMDGVILYASSYVYFICCFDLSWATLDRRVSTVRCCVTKQNGKLYKQLRKGETVKEINVWCSEMTVSTLSMINNTESGVYASCFNWWMWSMFVCGVYQLWVARTASHNFVTLQCQQALNASESLGHHNQPSC